jgi:GNAT superfamily N-acetyltransferase
METDTCDACSVVVTADDRPALEAAMLEHFTTTHPEWGITATAVTNYYDAKERVGDRPTERLDTIGDVVVYPVTPERVDDVIEFFDGDAFADNPAWGVCYCMFFHRDEPANNSNNPWRQNRAEIAERLRAGTTIGYLAYVEGRVAGWCNASLRSAYPTRRKGDHDDDVGVVACFVIGPQYRRHGVSSRLLDAALAGFAGRGIRRVEAHPVIGSDDDAPNYHGPLPLYLAKGFVEVSRDERSALVVKEL